MRLLSHHDHDHDHGGSPEPGHDHHPNHVYQPDIQSVAPSRPNRRLRGAILTLAFILVLVGFIRSVVMVDQTEVVYVTEFGRPVRLIQEPGLTFKWPHQSRRGFDRRLQVDSPPPREMLTKDKKNLQVAWYTGWKIDNVDRFLSTVRTIPDASARLEDMAASVLAAELGGLEFSELIQVGDDSALARLMDEVAAEVRRQAHPEYGVEIVDIRLRRLNYPEEVRPAVFEQIRSERRRVAAATRAEGESQARRIRSAADLEHAKAIAQAEADALLTVGKGEAEAARIANEAHAADPAFYRFLKTLETYRVALDEKTTLVLSAESPFLRLLAHGVDGPFENEPPATSAVTPDLARQPERSRPAIVASPIAPIESSATPLSPSEEQP